MILNFLKSLITIHFSCCFYFGLLAAYLNFHEVNPFMSFIKGFFLFPTSVIYLGCLLFSSYGVTKILLGVRK